MKKKRKDFSDEIARMMPLLIREITRRKSTVFSGKEIMVGHIAIIEFLAEMGASSMGEIAGVLHLSMSAATNIIDKMIDMGFVKRERSEKDRRVVLVHLDKKGKEAAGKIMDNRKEALVGLLAPLNNIEREEYLRILKKIHDNLREKYEGI